MLNLMSLALTSMLLASYIIPLVAFTARFGTDLRFHDQYTSNTIKLSNHQNSDALMDNRDTCHSGRIICVFDYRVLALLQQPLLCDEIWNN